MKYLIAILWGLTSIFLIPACIILAVISPILVPFLGWYWYKEYLIETNS